MSSQKGQSAMEYLMTYGWALLVIVIVIAVLMFIRPFGAPESCIFQSPGFSCEGQRIFSSTAASGFANTVSATILNGQQKAIKDIRVICIRGSTSPPASLDSYWKPLSTGNVAHGESIGLLEKGKGAPCYDVDTGGSYSRSTIAAGEDFAGRLYLKFHYRDEPTSIPEKIAVANVIGRAQ